MTEEAVVEETQPLLPDTRQENRNEFIGLVLTAISALMFSLMSVLVKLAGNYFPSIQVVFIRSVIQLVLGVLGCLYLKVEPWGPSTVNRWLLVGRGSAGAIGLGCYFFTLINMPLGDGTTIFFMAPAFTSIAAYFALKEQFMGLDGISVIFCLIGVALVSRPEFIFGHTDSPNHYYYDVWIPASAALAGALISSVAYCLVRVVGKRVNFMVHVTYFGAMSTLLSGVILYGFNTPVPVQNWTCEQTGILIGVGLMAFTAQCFLNKGLQLAKAGPATLMRNLDIVFAFIFGVLFFNELPRLTSIIGAILIGCTTAAVALYKYYSK
ncbi:hypothetical protein HDV04_006303 [Boothiomyces sp. JEL0838]|nr:hypothetical protein HDV04_006303 [Boothiomyces sp. JEL0838]